MQAFPFFIFCGLLVASALAMGKEFKDNFFKIVDECNEKWGVDKETIMSFVLHLNVPKTMPENCITDCVLVGLGVLSEERKLVMEQSEKALGNIFTGEFVNKGKEIVQDCNKRAPPNSKDCAAGGHFLTCFTEESRKANFPLPNIL